MTSILGAGGEEWQTFEKGAGGDVRSWGEAVAEARTRIERLRTRPVRLRLLDRAGRPLAGRRIEAVQVDSAFHWGINGWDLLARVADGTFDTNPVLHVREMYKHLFNAMSVMHYWAEQHCVDASISEEYQGRLDHGPIERLVEWALGNRLHVKGHPLWWGVPKAVPAWLLRYDVATRRRFLEIRVRQLVGRFRGRIGSYDAVNEMLWEPTLANTSHRHWPHLEPIDALAEECAQVIAWARDEDPDATYLLNEYGVVHGERAHIPIAASDGTFVSRHRQLERYIELANGMAGRGGAPDAIGIQTPPGEWRRLGDFVATIDALGAGTGLPVHITEFRTDIDHLVQEGVPRPESLERLADYVEAVLTVSFGNPHCASFYFWGEPLFVDHVANRRTPTVVFGRVEELLTRRWRTCAELVADGDGVIAFRGYCGSYRLRVALAAGSRGCPLEVPVAVGHVDQELRLDLV